MKVIDSAIQRYNDSYKRVIIAVHTANKSKTPIPVDTRLQYVDWSIHRFIPQHLEAVSIFNSDKLSEGNFYSTLCKFKERLKRMSGEPRESVGLDAVVFSRSPGCSSTKIRECIRKGNVGEIQGFVAEKVLEEIMKNGLYGYQKAA